MSSLSEICDDFVWAVLMLGIPLWLVFRAWQRYRKVSSSQIENLVPLHLAMFSLLLTQGVSLFLIVAMALPSKYLAWLGPRSFGLFDIFLCATCLLALLVAKGNQLTVQVWKAIIAATVYVLFFSLFLISAH